MRSLGGSFTSSGTTMFLLFLIVAVIFSEWSSAVSVEEDGTVYQKSESYTGIRCLLDRCEESCNSEGNTAGGICRRGSFLQVIKRCYCVMSPADDALGPPATDAAAPVADYAISSPATDAAAPGADYALSPAADDYALAPDASSGDVI